MPITDNSEYTCRFAMVFKKEDRGALQALADDAGVNESELIRRWIADAYAQRFGRKPPPEPRAKYNSAAARKAKKRAKK